MYTPIWWLPGMAFSIILVSYEELRKAIARKHPGSWADKETRYWAVISKCISQLVCIVPLY